MMDKIHLGNGKHQRISDIKAPKAYKILRSVPDTFGEQQFMEASGMAPATGKLYLKWLIKNRKVEKQPEGYRKININAGTRYAEPAEKTLL